MKKLYLDTGALVKLYIFEAGSRFVEEKAQAADRLPLNLLQETEFRNALYAAHGRKLISKEALLQTLRNFEEDVEKGYFQREEPDWPYLWKRAATLGRKYTPRLLCRTLDILHVAAAEYSDADELLTGDQRQLKLCKAIKLAVVEIPQGDKI